MNRYKNIAAVVFLLLLLTGCSDFLDIKPKGKDIAETIAHYNGLFNNNTMASFNYSRVMPNGSVGMLASNVYSVYMSDEHIADAESFARMDKYAQRAYTWNDDLFVDDAYSAEWGACYQHMYVYNVICENVMSAIDGTREEKEAILSEARVSRAYLYMMLVQWFCKPYNEATASTDLGVPIVKVPNSVETSFNRASVKEVYDFIITELEEACPLLQEKAQHRLRIYQPAGYMILGRAYMLTGQYNKAAEAFQKAETAISMSNIDLGLFDYNTMLSSWGYNPAVPHGWTSGYPNNFNTANKEVVYNKQISLLSIVMYVYNPSIYLKPEYYSLFQAGDHRRKFFANMNNLGNTTYPYHRRLGSRTLVNEGAEMPEFYLSYAESLARIGNTAKARQLLTTLREHRMEPGTEAIPQSIINQEDLVRFCVEERLREYMGTGHRWFDMRRLWHDPLFQHLKANYTHTDGTTTYTLTEKRLVMRIPSRVLDFNTTWIDNE